MALFRKGRRQTEAPDQAWVSALELVAPPPTSNQEVVEFVLTGRNPAVAATLAKSPHLVRPTPGTNRGGAEAIRRLYAGFGDVEADVLRRWGEVLDASWGSGSWGLVLGPVAGRHWPELMISQAAAAVPGDQPLPVSFGDLVRIAEVDGAGVPELLAAVFEVPRFSRYQRNTARDHISRLPGFAAALLEQHPVVARALTTGSAESRAAAIHVVSSTLPDRDLVRFGAQFAEAATASSTRVRDAARGVLRRLGGAGVAPLRTLAVEGDPDQRGRALEALSGREDQRDWALETAGSDRAASVRALAAQWRVARTPADHANDLGLPDPPAATAWAVAAPAAERCAREMVNALAEGIRAENQRREQLARRSPTAPAGKPLPPLPAGAARELTRLLTRNSPPGIGEFAVEVPLYLRARALAAVAGGGTVYPVSAVKLVAALGLFDQATRNQWFAEVVQAVHARTGAPDLLTLQGMLDETGVDGVATIWSSFARKWGTRLGRGWPDQQVWPFVARNLEWIITHGSTAAGLSWDFDQQAIFAAAETLPRMPSRLLDHLYATALTGRKADRGPAQTSLAGDPQRAERAAAALQDGGSETRVVAAKWLARICDPATLPALRAAWRRERQDAVRGALLDALVALGESAETYLDPQRTIASAAAFVAKGLPPALEWLDWGTVPEVAWRSSGEPVPQSVVQWLCASAVRGRSPEPDAVLRHYAALFEPAGRERLGHHLLLAWLQEDVRPVPAAQAEQSARQQALAGHRWLTGPDSRYAGMSVDELVVALLPSYLRQPAGSAVASKGLLAVVAACGGRDVVDPAERYLREWYGQRAAQGKALIGMLAWVEHPGATQLVLSVGSRFRTKSFQDEAARQAEALAERKGWTVEELADRTIPSAGFDARGVLELPYGTRAFSARLLPDLTVELRDPDGRVIKALPAPRQSDDPDRAQESRKSLAAAKKDLKAVAALQQRRLYEALCTERSWSVEDWQRYMLAHPVVGPLARRLVWVVGPADGRAGGMAVRPLDDGSLTDVDDRDVLLPAEGRIRLAHESVLTAEQVGRWIQHLADYEGTPLFEQLGRGLHAMASQQLSERGLADFEGYLLEAFALRGRATRLGYTRGATEDGGWFFGYEKRFVTLGIVATIEFSGNELPEQNRIIALRRLTFHRELPGQQVELTLGDVPAVLLSECWHDLRLLAAEGSGFDPDWERKVAS